MPGVAQSYAIAHGAFAPSQSAEHAREMRIVGHLPNGLSLAHLGLDRVEQGFGERARQISRDEH